MRRTRRRLSTAWAASRSSGCETHLETVLSRAADDVLENSGQIDPEKIDEYIGRGGYLALMQALTEMDPQAVIEQISKSGLRGRGGGGYPTGLKWGTVAKAVGAQKYVICNGDEGDPGAFMDRSVLESNPQRVIEGMAIAAYAVGASKGYIYVRAEYPLAVSRLTVSLREARRRGFLGNNICGTHIQLSTLRFASARARLSAAKRRR